MANSDNLNQTLDVGAKFADSIMRQEGSSAFYILESWFNKAGLRTYFHSSLERATNFRFDCMDTAAAEGYLNVVAILLEAETAATTDIRYGHLLCNFSRRGIISLIRFLLQKGVDPGSMGEDGNPALQTAAAHGHTEIGILLVENGAHVDAQGVSGTALYAAVKIGSAEMIKLLLSYGADPNAKGVNGTALDAAVRIGSEDII